MPSLRFPLCTAFALLAFCSVSPAADAPWRSALYPENWKPCFADAEGRFLHDFSYAGYHRGERQLPKREGLVFDVSKPPFEADPTGKRDATSAIQAAIEAAGKAGGGVVFLPPGTYRIAPQGSDTAALKLQDDHVVLRGAGVDKTFIFNDTMAMRGKTAIEVKPKAAPWWFGEGKWAIESAARTDLPNSATEIPVEDPTLFAPGDLVIVRNDLTERFIGELGMTGHWTRENLKNRSLVFCRRVVSVDPENKTVVIDVPIRYPLQKGDNARLIKMPGKVVSEVGLEDFSIGLKEHSGTELGDFDYVKEGTAGYDAYQSFAIVFEGAENSWMRRVNSYCPPGNTKGFHVISNGVKLARSRFVSVEDCDWRNAQYQGGGGNGYLYTVNANECLLRNCHGEAGRHNFDFQNPSSSGNVLLDCTTKDGFLASDFHMYFSVANLLDNVTCDGDFVEAVYRPYGKPIHGVTTTQSVFWNTHGVAYGKRKKIIVESKQYGHGYVIGTRGPANAVDSDDFVEGVGRGDTLTPRSLYLDQLSRRLRACLRIEKDG